jgi:hypothetical protein
MDEELGEDLGSEAQTSRRESEPAHFFVNQPAAKRQFSTPLPRRAVANSELSSFVVLFRYSSAAILMQKIHTLTDN